MKLAVRTAKVDVITHQLLTSLALSEHDIVAIPTNYCGITLLNIDESAATSSTSIRNIEALLLDEAAAAELQYSSAVRDVLSFKSLDDVDEREQYEHLSQLLHIQKATGGKR